MPSLKGWTARRVLERWHEAPSSLSPEFVPDPAHPGALMESEGTKDFEELFRPEALSALGQGFFMRGAEAEKWASSSPRRTEALS